METYLVPGVNHLGTHGRWSFAEFTEIYRIEADFEKKVEAEFNTMIQTVSIPNSRGDAATNGRRA